MKIDRIGQIAVPVHDMHRAINFYQNILGLRLMFKAGDITFFDLQGVRLMLAKPEKDDQTFFGSIIYYQVDDIQHAYDELLNQGVHLIGKPHVIASMNQVDTWMAFFKDSEGNTLALMSETKK